MSTEPTPAPAGPSPTGDPLVPPLLRDLVDDAAVFPPGNAPLAEALQAHAAHRASWYADLVGPLLLPASTLSEVTGPSPPRIGVVGDSGPDGVSRVLVNADGRWAQLEVAVARRGEDPLPGLRTVLATTAELPELPVYAEVPLTSGLRDALDTLAAERAAGRRVAPKFRTGGLAAELFPSPVELAAIICECRERDLPFKLTAGLHHAVRHTDTGTGFAHHGFLNVLVACLAATDGAEATEVAEVLAGTEPAPLVAAALAGRGRDRPLWVGFGSCSVPEPLADLTTLGLIDGGAQ